ncbi:dicarboxylate/amino acid:cation symporter [Sphingorhabdus arenilitoris]|uniref:Dicarboxylate/amino acid:cation symporter n=1 Tax=Sphingorhabdus arenilitoris TaxID=1490041 RepID=A0ABV8RIF0_9SPHN
MQKALFILAALIIGLICGMLLPGGSDGVIKGAEFVGALWLNGLRMTIIPLVVSLLIVGIVQTAVMAKAGRMTFRAIATMIAILWASAAMAALFTPALLALFPLPADAAAALQSALSTAQEPGPVPSILEFFRDIVPANPVAAAANDAILPLIIFTLAFAFAVTRLPEKKRSTIADFFAAISEAMLILVQWVLALAPVGVFALALVVGARAGAQSFVGLAHYVLIVVAVGTVIYLASFLLALLGAKRSPLAFFRASIPAQAVAISTQSSLASLPAMVQGVKAMGVGERSADVVLPISVALFRATGPCMNLAVAIYVAHLMGIEITTSAMIAGIVAAAITTMGAVSLPGSVSFITSIAPINIAMGLPVEPLVLLLAIEAFPDIMRTLANVTMDMAVTGTVARFEGDLAEGETS